jgi:hypothetical protein
MLLLAELRTLSDLAPYLGLLAFGFLLGAWGGSARSPLAVAFAIALIVLAIVLFQLQVNDLPDNPPPGSGL